VPVSPSEQFDEGLDLEKPAKETSADAKRKQKRKVERKALEAEKERRRKGHARVITVAPVGSGKAGGAEEEVPYFMTDAGLPPRKRAFELPTTKREDSGAKAEQKAGPQRGKVAPEPKPKG